MFRVIVTAGNESVYWFLYVTHLPEVSAGGSSVQNLFLFMSLCSSGRIRCHFLSCCKTCWLVESESSTGRLLLVEAFAPVLLPAVVDHQDDHNQQAEAQDWEQEGEEELDSTHSAILHLHCEITTSQVKWAGLQLKLRFNHNPKNYSHFKFHIVFIIKKLVINQAILMFCWWWHDERVIGYIVNIRPKHFLTHCYLETEMKNWHI